MADRGDSRPAMADLTGTVALVTGAARGLGRAVALALADAGADLAVCDVPVPISSVPYQLGEEAGLKETVTEIENRGRRCVSEPADVRSQEELARLADRAARELGGITVVVASAGIISYGAAWELLDEQWDDVISVNLTGAWRTCKAAIPVMLGGAARPCAPPARATGNGRTGGAIVLVSSVTGLRGVRGVAHYSAAKHGLIGLMQALAVELAPHGIRVNAVCPTVMDTPMMNNPHLSSLAGAAREPTIMRHLLADRIDTADVAHAIRWLVSDEARYITGTALPIDAGFLLS